MRSKIRRPLGTWPDLLSGDSFSHRIYVSSGLFDVKQLSAPSSQLRLANAPVVIAVYRRSACDLEQVGKSSRLHAPLRGSTDICNSSSLNVLIEVLQLDMPR